VKRLRKDDLQPVEEFKLNLLDSQATQFAILDSLKVGVSIIDRSYRICYINEEMITRGWHREHVIGRRCYLTYNEKSDICEGCPAREVFRTGKKVDTVQKGRDGHYYQLIASPILDPNGDITYVAEITRDVTRFLTYQKRIESLYQSVDRLLGILPEIVMQLDHRERAELIRNRIQELSQDLLPYDNFIVDVIDPDTKRLEPLICFGAYELEDIKKLDRRVGTEHSGITGYVATTGRSYLCKDCHGDPRYIHGITGARTSMTVPLRLSDRVLGTLNVESSTPGTFTEEDLKYLEIFAHFVAIALNTTNLLQEEEIVSVRRIAEILADRLNNSLAGIVQHLYLLKQLFIQDRSYLRTVETLEQQVNEMIADLGTSIKLDRIKSEAELEIRPEIVQEKFKGLRVLVAEDQVHIRKALHKTLKIWGFECDTAKDGAEAISLIQSRHYDLILSDVVMPRKTGRHVFRAAQEALPNTPVIFITGGYDPSHASIELPAAAVLYKPFKVIRLKDTIHKVLGDRPGKGPAP
jgi:PAS domain S-box-containing protein